MKPSELFGKGTSAISIACFFATSATSAPLPTARPTDQTIQIPKVNPDIRNVERRNTGHTLDAWFAPYPEPCEAAFEKIARDRKQLLLDLLQSNLDPSHLTFAAEIAGKRIRSPEVRSALINLLRHRDAGVREGALYGLASAVSESNVLQAIKGLAESDPSPAVRSVAQDIANC